MTDNAQCPNCSHMIIVGRNPEKKKAIVFNPRCNQWDCEYCWQIKRDEWRDRVARGVANLLLDHQLVWFVTLTGRGYFTPASSIYFMRQNWPKLHERIKYRTNKWSDATGVKWRYVLIPERHKSGVAHWHVICTTFESKNRWWKDNAYQCGFGYIADVREVEHSVAASNYVAKYLTKDAGGHSWPKGFRRVRTSRNWPASENILPDGFDYERVVEAEIDMIKLDCQVMGWSVEDTRQHNQWES